MALIKDLSCTNFIRVPRKLRNNVSKNAIYVFLQFESIYPSLDPTDIYMCVKCSMSLKTYKKAKKELIDYGFLFVHRRGAKGAVIDYYYGENAVTQIKNKLQKRKEQKIPSS